jgi:hypothetical protein
MAVTVRRVTLWRREVDNRPGALARILEPLAEAATDLQVAMGYRIPGQESRAVLELAPVTGRGAVAAAEDSGLSRSDIPTLVVEGDNAPGMGLRQSQVLAEAGVNIAFLIAQVVGRRFSAVFGFESADDAARAQALLKRASAPVKKRAGAARPRPPARKRPAAKRARARGMRGATR